MYFEQFYLGCLAHASYMIGSEGIAAVVDPQRTVEIYLDQARKNGLRIEHVIETHLHADFVSGHRELAARTGAKIYLGAGQARNSRTWHRTMATKSALANAVCSFSRPLGIPSKAFACWCGSRSRARAVGGAYRRHPIYR